MLGWHLVWTGDGKVFFFNPTTKLSIWERPSELESNFAIDEMLRQGPEGKPPEKKEQQVTSDVDMEKSVELKTGMLVCITTHSFFTNWIISWRIYFFFAYLNWNLIVLTRSRKWLKNNFDTEKYEI